MTTIVINNGLSATITLKKGQEPIVVDMENMKTHDRVAFIKKLWFWKNDGAKGYPPLPKR